MKMENLVGLVGSRDLSIAYRDLVGEVAKQVEETKRRVITGDAQGADKYAREESHTPLVVQVESNPNKSYAQRLRERTLRVVEELCLGGVEVKRNALISFWSKPNSPGTFLACRAAQEADLPVYGFICSFTGFKLPPLGRGEWVKVNGKGIWQNAYKWRKAWRP